MTQFEIEPSARGMLPNRREWLRIGFPLLASPLVASSSSAYSPKKRRVKSVLIIFVGGGQSQLDTWDPKPNAPEEIRGAFRSIPTAIPGVRISEHLPRTAKLAKHFKILRSMTHDDLDHGSACYLALTGQFHPRKSSNPAPKPSDFPTLGAVLHRVQPSKSWPHSSFQVNGPLLVPEVVSPGRSGGLLGRSYDPIDLGNPEENSEFLETFVAPKGVDRPRMNARRDLRDTLQSGKEILLENSAWESSVKHAQQLADNRDSQRAFQLELEPPALRARYGLHRSGQACLLGRRLVEAGIPWVTVFYNHTIRGQDKLPNDTEAYGWDTHNDVFDALKSHLLPRFDETFSTLISDMHERGSLKDTLIVCMGEFGRAPKVALETNFAGTSPGRKHWAACYSVVLAGVGMTGGIYGSSDRIAAYPQENPTTPGDLCATMFDALSIDASSHYTDSENRPYRLTTGTAVPSIFS